MELTLTRTITDRQAEVRARLLDAARELGRTADTVHISMGTIAAKAGVSKATAYRLFSSLDQLLTEAAGVTVVIVLPDSTTGRFVAEAWRDANDARSGLEADGMGAAVTIAAAYAEAVARCLRSTTP